MFGTLCLCVYLNSGHIFPMKGDRFSVEEITYLLTPVLKLQATKAQTEFFTRVLTFLSI